MEMIHYMLYYFLIPSFLSFIIGGIVAQFYWVELDHIQIDIPNNAPPSLRGDGHTLGGDVHMEGKESED